MKRFWEIDALRGFAIILMVIFNYSFALRFLGVYTLNAGSEYWWLFPRLIAGIFIFLVGISLSISRRRQYRHFFKRGLWIFALGMLATAATWLYVGQGFVVFGILHLIGLSIILAPLFFRLKKFNIILGLSILLFGFYLNSLTFAQPWLLWLGLVPSGFFTIDYFPLLPWFGFVLIGLAVGNRLYPKSKRSFSFPDLSRTNIIKQLSFLGRHSLLIYVVHQPLLLVVLMILSV